MQIFGVGISRLDHTKFFDEIKDPDKKIKIYTPNPEILLAAKDNPRFRDVLNGGEYVIPDGMGLFVAYQMLDNRMGKIANILLFPWYGCRLFTSRKSLYAKYGGRIIGSILTARLLEHADKTGKGVTIIDKFQPAGNHWDNLKRERQGKMLELLGRKFPGATFHYHIHTKENEEAIVSQINATRDIYLFATHGMIAQERAISDLMPKLENIRLAAGVGGSFDLILGFKKKAPKLIIDLGFEWLWRLIFHPLRMTKRIWRAFFVFPWEVAKSKEPGSGRRSE